MSFETKTQESNKSLLEKFKEFMNRDNVVGYVFSSPFIIGFLAFTLIPMIASVYFSFTNYDMISDPQWLGLANYTRLFNDSRFINSVVVTLIYVAVSVPVKLAFALFVAMLLSREIKGSPIYRALFYLPSLVGGSVAVAIVWKRLFASGGPINTLISAVGLEPINWFGDASFAMTPLILMTAWQFGSSMIIFLAGIKDIPKTYYEAAKIDGASSIQQFFKITLPLLTPLVLFNLIMQTITAFMAFTQAFIITGGGPNDATNFYALYVYDHAFTFRNMGYASAMSWIMLVIIAIVTYIIFKTSDRWTFYVND